MDKAFFESIKSELKDNILPFWEKNALDKNTHTKGFYGKINNDNTADNNVSRTIVMTARFLWTYSAAARYFNEEKYLETAEFAAEVIMHQFFDTHFGGMYWSVKPDGKPDVDKKQIYGQAFACYALSEYAAALREVKNQSLQANVVMDKALALYTMMETYAKDKENGGYIEALSENWQPTEDMRLSEKDMNCAKSMNTNLHVLEAYTNLVRNLRVVYPENAALRKLVESSLKELIHVIVSKIFQKDGHLGLFFDKNWNRLDSEISYGHDIECSWLLWEAANELHDMEIFAETHLIAERMAEVSLKEGFNQEKGYLSNCLKDGKKDNSSIWWIQAEALTGFYNAFDMSGRKEFGEACEKEWNWIIKNQKDKENGDWWAVIKEDGNPDLAEPKGGNWKTSYHNARCCMELLKRSHN